MRRCSRSWFLLTPIASSSGQQYAFEANSMNANPLFDVMRPDPSFAMLVPQDGP